MRAKLSYADAARLLGGGGPVLEALDRVTGGLLLAATGGGSELALSLFDAKGELARLSHQLVSGLGERMRGLSRFDRTDRLAAAHRVLVLTAFFDAVHEVPLPFDASRLRLTKAEQVGLGAGEAAPSSRLRALAGILLGSDIPLHSPRDNPTTAGDELRLFYRSLAGDLLGFVKGLAVWDTLPPADRERFAEALAETVPGVALRRYEELFTRLAVEFPEVAFWTGRQDHEATRREVRRLSTGMEGLGRVLDDIATGRRPDDRRRALSRAYRAQLERPIVTTGDAPEGLVIPPLGGAYVNPGFRVAPVIRSDRLDEESWWAGNAVRDDLQSFLIGHLTSPLAVECPLIVLGQPGSGKSVLTKVLAARLPPSDFMAVRVLLREVPADTDLQSQIEYAVRNATGESLSWPELARAAGDALPVVLLDGFDELLQATNIGQSDFLEQVVRFQEREADQGRPVAFVVTSRTAVADRARIPPGGAVAVRLEPFTGEQIERWLTVWNGANAAYLAGRGLLPLSPAAVSRQPDLASQPLLLLMLALYDAADNALQRDGESLDPADLYDRILVRFAEREILKSSPGMHGDPLRAAVEEELLRLSVTAFAMFNRGRQWVSEEELDADLTALLGAQPKRPVATFGVPSTPAQIVVGRFFFVHQAQAIRDDRRLTTCEFLHATFGEYLVARLIARELADLVAVIEVATSRTRVTADSGFLRALLSFAPLTTRGPIMGFLATLCGRFGPARTASLRGLLLTYFGASLRAAKDVTHADYEPVRLHPPGRHAAYSANMVLLLTLVGAPVAGHELFPSSRFPASDWRRCALLWRSQFSGEGWRGLAAAVRLERVWHDDERDVVISMGPWTAPRLDPFWSQRMLSGSHSPHLGGWRRIMSRDLRRESYFTCDIGEDLAWHGLEPFVYLPDIPEFAHEHGEAVTEFSSRPDGRARSTAHALLSLWLTSCGDFTAEELAAAYRVSLDVVDSSRPSDEAVSRYAYFAMVLRQLAADAGRLSAGQRARLLRQLRDNVDLDLLLNNHPEAEPWERQAFGDLDYPGARAEPGPVG
ncbi:ATP-binding protein [Sphaerisporangium sp. TRM90804]|uniref:NACHT domain-containing protein n=1 Tax=Sphaerisporangium sp. TRM90804 TaxID=3031113 RepID=UPI00244CBBD8|nr:ATP-binding protein [Sphaerisporangium sp. TRM90804]MDH2428021.1 ATP-binding protein [Sphaerisporangium sp. TRM90804]